MTAFDTLTAARELEAAGVDRKQAEAIAGIVLSAQGELATKSDLLVTRSELRAEMSEMNTRINAMGTRINALQWVLGVNLAISLATLGTVLAMAFNS